MLNLYSQTTLPVSASSAITRSCSVGPASRGILHVDAIAHRRSAPSGRHAATRHRKFWPLSAHFSTRPVSVDDSVAVAVRALRPVAEGDLAGALRGSRDDQRRDNRDRRQNVLLNILYNVASDRIGHVQMCLRSTGYIHMPRNSRPNRTPNVRGAPVSPTNPGRRQSGVGKGNRDVAGVERVPHPYLAERVLVRARRRAGWSACTRPVLSCSHRRTHSRRSRSPRRGR